MAIKFSNTFLLRKLHQLTGIVPLGIFFFVHMYTNSTAMNGAAVFNEHVQDIHDMPYLLFIEIFGIFLPLLFHSIYGILISAEAKPNALNYGYARNWFYIFQRVTGIFLFFFLVVSYLEFSVRADPGTESSEARSRAMPTRHLRSSRANFRVPWVMVIYILGVLATAWHLAYGFFLFAVDWGIVIGEKAQKSRCMPASAWPCSFGAVGINAAVAFVRPAGFCPSRLREAEPNGVVQPTGPTRFSRIEIEIMASTGLKIAIVGGGLAGLAAAMKIAEAGHEVDLISVVPVKRSHSVCAQGGINGAVNTKGEGDSPAKHLDDTVYGGDFLANQPPVKRMCDMAPQIIYLVRPHGRAVFANERRTAGLSPIWRNAASPHGVCRSVDRTTASLRAR